MSSEKFHSSKTNFLKAGEEAAVLRVSMMTVYRQSRASELPADRLGRSIRVRQEDLDRYLSDQISRRAG